MAKDTHITFGKAIEALKEGKLVARTIWNGQAVFIRPYDRIDTPVVINIVKSLPQSVKDHFDALGSKSDFVDFSAYLCMIGNDELIINGWLPSAYDILAEDWLIVNK